PETAAIPVIFMTALSDIFDKVKGFEIGAVDYITKPFQQEEVIARVKLHLRLHHLSQKLSHKVEEQAETEAKLQRLNQELEARSRPERRSYRPRFSSSNKCRRN
ncbi:MAG: response regulator transcription factor, partial [Leptolyngbya sp. RL_3_1]|nr:response regulator transcription factor [Leptolyngbya sp. RL_3_1]